MLGTLCTLITVLSCVSGVIVVTQKPPVLSVSKGDTATMDCNLGTETGYGAWWYKQVPGGAPQYVLYFHHSYNAPKYGDGFSSPRFTSNHQTKSDYRLIIQTVEAGDSAVYYCKTWDSPAKDEELKTNKATVVCLAQMSVGFADVSWTSGGKSVTGGVFTGTAEQKPDKTFGLSSFLTITPSEWITDRVFTCKVSVGSKTSEKSIKKSDCSE